MFAFRWYFSNILEYEHRRIIELRRRGYDVTRIAWEVYGDKRKRYWVWRILRRLRRLGLLECLLRGKLCCACGGDAAQRHVAPSKSVEKKGDDSRGNGKRSQGKAQHGSRTGSPSHGLAGLRGWCSGPCWYTRNSLLAG